VLLANLVRFQVELKLLQQLPLVAVALVTAVLLVLVVLLEQHLVDRVKRFLMTAVKALLAVLVLLGIWAVLAVHRQWAAAVLQQELVLAVLDRHMAPAVKVGMWQVFLRVVRVNKVL
jgi:Mn2+/Fe2+ NRAMP family transporter